MKSCSSQSVPPVSPVKHDKNGKEVSKQMSPCKSKLAGTPQKHQQPTTDIKELSLPESLTLRSNKENQEEWHSSLSSSHLSDSEDFHCSPQEDSGYLSLHNSQLEEPEAGAAEHRGSSHPPHEADRFHLTLPIVQFQQAACKQLLRSYRRTRKFNSEALKDLARKYGLQHVIGGNMGLECVDVIEALLEKDLRHVLAKILCLLGDKDLISFSSVSHKWRKVICEDKRALHRCEEAQRRLSERQPALPLTTRDFAAQRVALSSMQCLAPGTKQTLSHKDCKESRNASEQTRFSQFQKAASSLKQHESLKPCKRCGSPALYDAPALRATCTSGSCGFHFCTRCLCTYHGSAPCQLTTGSFTHTRLIGTSCSKRSVRRL